MTKTADVWKDLADDEYRRHVKEHGPDWFKKLYLQELPPLTEEEAAEFRRREKEAYEWRQDEKAKEEIRRR